MICYFQSQQRIRRAAHGAGPGRAPAEPVQSVRAAGQAAAGRPRPAAETPGPAAVPTLRLSRLQSVL